MRIRVQGRRGTPMEIVIDELVVDREVAADPRRLEAALARELDRRLSLDPAWSEHRGRSGEMGRLVAGEVAARMGPATVRPTPTGPAPSRGAQPTGTPLAAPRPTPGGTP